MSFWSLVSTSWARSQRYLRVDSRAMSRQRGRRLQTQLGLEPLEDRTLLSASLVDETHTHSHGSLLDQLSSGASFFQHGSAHEKIDPDAPNTFYIAPQQHLFNQSGFLSGPTAGQPLDIALDFLRNNAEDLGLEAVDFDHVVVTDQYTSQSSGVTHIYLRQTYSSIEIVNAEININISEDGEVINVGSSFVSGLHTSSQTYDAIPTLTATGALASLSDLFDWTLQATTDEHDGEQHTPGTGPSQVTILDPSGVSLDNIPVELHFTPTEDGGIALMWNLVVRTVDGGNWFEAGVSAETGQLNYFSDWGADAVYNVYASPLENPNDGNRTLEVDPHDLTASPYGWHDTDGVDGAEFTDTRGNNVFAQEDADANDSGGARPDGGDELIFDFDIDFSQDPSIYVEAATTNLFYWNNVLHDIHYQYGFDEASGNFQENNYGNGGNGGDAVSADAQDGSGFNNANFFTPPDGFTPRMQQFIFDLTNPNRDSSLSNSIIIHEYGHGVSNRLTGGPGNSGALNAIQSGGMGEGWSDWWSLMLTQKPGDAQFDAYAVGDYVLDDPAGIRRFPYSFDMTINPLTYGDYNGSNQVHDAGEIWASALWDLNWLLINGDGGDIPAMGFDPDLYNGTGGNNFALQLVMDALKLQPANPSFLDARDAILAADQVATGGANQLAIWTAFARRGMGFSAFDGGSANATSVIEAFDLPATSEGEISLDANVYEVGDPLTISLRDSDLAGGGPVNVSLVSSGGDAETISLIEVGPGIGVFEATVSTAAASAPGDGILGIGVGDVITVTYNDADDGTGNPAVVFDTADVIFLVDIFEQDFETGLGSNETLFGGFTINDTNTPLNNGTLMVGHPSSYINFDHSYYEVTLDLTNFRGVSLQFEYAAWIEDFYDGFNLQASTSDISPPGDLITPVSGLPYDQQNPGPIFTPPPEIGTTAYDSGGLLDMGIAVFDLSAFDGQIVNVRFQFGSDNSVTFPGINFDNILVQGQSVEGPPSAEAGGPYVFGNRSVIRLDASGSMDPNQSTATLTYEWDFNNDGQYDARGMRPYFDTSLLNGKPSTVVRLKVTDDAGTYDGDWAKVYLDDPSRLNIIGDTNGVVGQSRRIKFDLGPAATELLYTYTVNWGDGGPTQTFKGPAGAGLSHIYNETGVYLVKVTAVNLMTGLNSTDTHRIRISRVEAQGDDFAITGNDDRDDNFEVFSRGGDLVEVFLNGRSYGVHSVPGRFYAFGLGGDDTFRYERGTMDVFWDGGEGDDVSFTYGGNDIIYGRNGNDIITIFGGNNYVNAGMGDNIVRTRAGNDRIYTGIGDDKISVVGGNNDINAGHGNNWVFTGIGDDFIFTGAGNDQIESRGGSNYIDAGNGSNQIQVGRGNDIILGGIKDDHVDIGGGTNIVATFADDDYIVTGGSMDQIDAGTGRDFVLGFNFFNVNFTDEDLLELLAKARLERR